MSNTEGNPGSHVCVLCNSTLESKEALKDHFRKHANKEIDLKGRKLTPTGEIEESTKPSEAYIKGTASSINTSVVCDVCGESFNCNTKAIQHKFKKHPYSNTKHYCPMCGMQFPLKGHRDKHVKDEHEGEIEPRNPYPCYQCGAMFFNKKAHEYHDKSAHHRVVTLYKQVETPPPTKKIKYNNAGDPQSVYYCHLCGFEYIVKFNLQKHLERQHSFEERRSVPNELFKCNTCDGLFYNHKAYQNHTMYHKPGDIYVASEEQRLATVTRVDQDFDIRRVQPIIDKYMPKYRAPRRQVQTVDSEISIVESDPSSLVGHPMSSHEEPPEAKKFKNDTSDLTVS